MTPAKSEYSTPTRSTSYKYRELATAAGACTGRFVAVWETQSLKETRSLSSAEYTYVNQQATRDHGRLQQRISRLLGKYPITYDWVYSYPTKDHFKTIVKATAFDGIAQQVETISSLSTGLITAHTDQDNNEGRFQYDDIGRLVKEIISPDKPHEATRETGYALGPGGIGCCIMTTDFQGVQTRKLMDGLGRARQIERQDDQDASDSESTSPGPFRLIQERRYNELGQCIAVDDIDWLRTDGKPTEQRTKRSMEYDNWGQVCRVTDGSGVAVSSIADPIHLTRMEGIEGKGQTKAQFNQSGAITQKILLKKDGKEYSRIEFAYNGWSHLMKETDSFGRITQYQVDDFDRVTETTWPDERTVSIQYAAQSTVGLPVSVKVDDHTMGTQSFDGLHRVTSQDLGPRTTTMSFQGNVPKASRITTPKGDNHDLTYDPALKYALTDLQSSDDSNLYQYDKRSAATQRLESSYTKEQRQYLLSGLLTREEFQFNNNRTFSAQSVYSMAGKLQCYTDVHGQSHDIQYDDFGRPKQLTQGNVNVTFTYNIEGRLSESRAYDNESNQSLSTRRAYDEFGREIERTVSKGTECLYRLSQRFDETSLVVGRSLKDGNNNILRDESFRYDSRYRLVDYQCQGSKPPTDGKGQALQRQKFSFNKYDNLIEISTAFQDGTRNSRSHVYSTEDPTQLIQITNTHPSYPSKIDLEYDKNGCLTRDDQGRTLGYDTRSRLSAVFDTAGKILCRYYYDASGKLVCQEAQGTNTYLHYRGDALIGVTTGDSKVSFISDGGTSWGQILQKDGKVQTQLWASDVHQSVLAWLDTQQPDQIHHQTYTPYGHDTGDSSMGFNGQWRDPVTGWYHLGNGYRVYNPALMSFHTPDQWSPFTSGEINPYAYCLGDPVSRTDSTGHFSIFGFEIGGRDIAMTLVGLGVGIAVVILTGGAGFAIEAGLAIAAGVASDVITGALYDVATGKSPTWESVDKDALFGAIGGAIGEIGGRVLVKGVTATARSVSRALGRSGSYAVGAVAAAAAERRSSRVMGGLAWETRTGHFMNGMDEFVYFDSVGGELGNEGLLTHGLPGYLMGRGRPGELRMLSARFVAERTILPEMTAAAQRQPLLNAIREEGRPFYLFACYGATPNAEGVVAGQSVANVLQRPVIAFEGLLNPLNVNIQRHTVYNALETVGGFERIYGQHPGIGFNVTEEAMDTS
ncbi:hypothetical protein MMC14_007208 [Varicellaria rhodocarpa]|nr:hypothetical protein [Varicellaria rhodocarpa]